MGVEYNRPLSPVQEARVRSVIKEETRELHSFNGSFLERFTAVAVSDGATITMTLENEEADEDQLTMRFSDGLHHLVTQPALSIVMTAGTDELPVTNYVYIPKSTQVLTLSTTDWPEEEHIRVSFFILQSATKIQSDGPLDTQNQNDHANGLAQGHILEMAQRLRAFGATWKDGCVLTPTIVTNGGSPDTVTLALSVGRVWQLHLHDIASIDMAGANDIHIVNHPTTKYFETADLSSELLDSTGTTMVNKYFNLFIWHVASKEGTHQPLMCNLPDGSYNTLIGAVQDTSGFDNQLVPAAFSNSSGTAWAVARLTFKHSNASGGTWTLESTKDLRGVPVNSVGGGTVISTDHGVLDGLADDDHLQYHTDARSLTYLQGNVIFNDLLDVAITSAARYDHLSRSNGGSWVNSPGGLIQLYDSVGAALTGSFVGVNWDNTPDKVGNFSHTIGAGGADITCDGDGYVSIDVSLSFVRTSGACLIEARLELDSGGGYAAIAGTTIREQTVNIAASSASLSITWKGLRSSGDKIRVVVKKTGGGVSIPAGEAHCNLMYLTLTDK